MSVTQRIPIVIAATRSVIVVNTFCGVSILTTRNNSDGVAGQNGGIGPKAAEVAPDEDANAYPENESRKQADTLAGKETGDHD